MNKKKGQQRNYGLEGNCIVDMMSVTSATIDSPIVVNCVHYGATLRKCHSKQIIVNFGRKLANVYRMKLYKKRTEYKQLGFSSVKQRDQKRTSAWRKFWNRCHLHAPTNT